MIAFNNRESARNNDPSLQCVRSFEKDVFCLCAAAKSRNNEVDTWNRKESFAARR